MSRLGMFACLFMLVAVAVCLDLPPNMKGPGELPKDAQGHPLPGHPPHPDGPHHDGQHPEAPRPEGGQMPKDNPKSDSKPPQEPKS